MREHEVNKLNNFICGWYFDDTTICDKLIDFHNNNDQKFFGGFGNDGNHTIDKSWKDSIDCVLPMGSPLWKEYCDNLQQVTSKYIEKYKFSDDTDVWGINDVVNVQKYPVNGGFHAWHTERNTGNAPAVFRHLVFMTYLNDITDAGETEFYHQGIKVKPEKGLTLIWGSDWTFTHRGIASPSQEKYIVTGWYNFIPRNLRM